MNSYVTCNPGAGLDEHQYINGNCYLLPNQIGRNGPLVTRPLCGPWFMNFDLGLFKNFQFFFKSFLVIKFFFKIFLLSALMTFFV